MIRIGKFTDFYSDVTKMGTKISQERYLSKGQFPIIDQGRQTIAGRWDDEDGIFSDVPAIVFGDHTRAIKYIEEPFFIGADGVKILRPKNTQDSPKYLFYALQAARIPDLGYSRHFKAVKELDIRVCSKEEQAEIVRILESIDFLIEKRHEEVRYLDQAVKSRFIELFGMPGADDFGWGLTPLGSICYINPKKGQDHRLGSGVEVSFVPMPAVTEHGKIDATAIKEYDEVKTGFTYFAENDVLFAKITPCMENGKGAVARGLHNGLGFGSTEFHVLRPISGRSNPYWIYTLTAFSQFREDAASNMTGSAGQRRVPASFLENYRVAVPPIELQQQFAAFVEQTDKSKYYSSLSFRYCQTAANTYRQEWMTCRTSDF